MAQEGRPTGYNWTEAREICLRANGTLPPAPVHGGVSCYKDMFRRLPSSNMESFGIWASSMSADLRTAGSFRVFVNYPTFDRYQQSWSTSTRAGFTYVVCRQGMPFSLVFCLNYMYTVHVNLCFVWEIQTEYKPRRIRGLYDGLYLPYKTKSDMYYTYADPVYKPAPTRHTHA